MHVRMMTKRCFSYSRSSGVSRYMLDEHSLYKAQNIILDDISVISYQRFQQFDNRRSKYRVIASVGG